MHKGWTVGEPWMRLAGLTCCALHLSYRFRRLNSSAIRSLSSRERGGPASSACRTSVFTERSRCGRYIIPAWQKRQPFAQPRIISSGSLSWTVWTKGTTGLVG